MTDKPDGQSNDQQGSISGTEGQNETPVLLIVEDDIDLLSFISSGFENQFEVIQALNGYEGLQKARLYIPDLVVTDLMMPIMDGISLCRELKTNTETSHIPVIMLTAKNSVESQLEGLKTGADDYITKPFHMVLLEARIQNLLKSRQILRDQLQKQFLIGETTSFIANALDREFMEKALQVIERNYKNWSFKSDEFAEALNISARTLQRKIRAVIGQSPANFMNEFRMMRAAKLLAETSIPITDIAFEVGCDESSHFTRVFKKYYEMNPSAYRAAHRTS